MTVFDFSDFRGFLKYRVSKELYTSSGRKKSNLAQVAKSLGYASPSLLSMVMNGKRTPSDELCETLVRTWNLSLKEKEYFRLLVQLEKKRKNGSDPSETVEQIRRVAGRRAAFSFSENEFSAIREWHYLVIKQLVETPSFREDPVWISKALRRRITPTQAQQALTQLETLRLLERDPVSNALRVANAESETTHDIPSAAIREHHKQMMQAAMEALETRPVAERQFNSLTFNVDPRRLPEIRKHLLDFIRLLDTDFSNKESDSVFQLNLQFFEHTIAPHPTVQGDSVENN
jgi:uncharacterized protein (TIGR02147 family)